METAPVRRRIRRRPETLTMAVLLSAVGGFLDAYTYLRRGVFANAQSGNVVLIAVEAAQRQWSQAATRLPAMLAFIVGLIVAHTLATEPARRLLRRPARWVLGVEVVLLALLGVLPADLPTAALTATVSFVAALQVSTFTAVGAGSYNTTMATGNLRTMLAAAFAALVDRDPVQARASGAYGAILVGFALGAALGAVCTAAYDARAIWVADLLLIAVAAAIVGETHRREHPRAKSRP